jgi:hypothetical protein
MSSAETTDYERVLKTVRSWSAVQRFTLVQDVLKTLAPSESPQRAAQPTLDRARGLLATGGPTPTDAEIGQWLDERRRERYGQ